jgi:hypothetical protein
MGVPEIGHLKRGAARKVVGRKQFGPAIELLSPTNKL